MDRRIIILFAAIIACLIAVPAYAEPSVTGPTGLIVNPTAETAPIDHMWVGINFIDMSKIIQPDQTAEGGTTWTGVLTGGVTDNFEVGLGFIIQEESDNGILFNAKAMLRNDDPDQWFPAVAIGGKFSKFLGKNDFNGYLVASKFFWLADKGYYGGSLHAGLDYDKPEEGDWNLNYFFGADLSFTEKLVAIAELSKDKGQFGDGFVYGVRYFFNDKTTAQAGFIDGDLTIGGCYIF
jgi:hypothetical protein